MRELEPRSCTQGGMQRASLLVLTSVLTGIACLGCPSSQVVLPPPVTVAADPATDAKIVDALGGPQRTDKERARDVYRHPRETLAVFGLRDDMTVVEISPGGGWYTAVLAPVLRDRGKLVIAGGDPNGDPKSEGTQDAQALLARFQKMPQTFGKVQSVVVSRETWSLGSPESADMVLTFRNFHNWVDAGVADKVLAGALAVLKHGGVLGLTDHRAKPGTHVDPKVVGDTGYVPEDYVIQAIEKAGFKLAARSEVNANPKDTKDYPKGVWTLPPTFELGDKDREKYAAIGESDRMTLKFVKP